MELASFSLIPGETMLSVRARAMGNIESGGIATTYEVTGRRVQLTVADIAWDTGQRDVRVVDIATGVGKLGRLLRGGRIGVYEANFESFPVDVAWFELSVMTLNRDARKLPTARKADYPTAVRAA